MNADIFAEVLYNVFNRSLEVGEFPSGMKVANVTTVQKKGSRYDKGNYRPVSILPNLSKVFERSLHKQISDFFDTILSKHQCGFRKGCAVQYCLIALLEKWQESIDRGLEFGILLTALSKVFDCLPHNLFVAKLFAYGFDDKALPFIYDCLRHHKQKNKIADSYSSWQETLYGVPQGSILVPLLFNADLRDLFITMSQCAIDNYSDDNTPHVSDRNIEEVVASLDKVSEIIFQWFRDNQF